MIFNYIKTALRNMRRSLSYTVINVLGLALGITCAVLIFSLVAYHLQFDNFHPYGDRIYRFVTDQNRMGQLDYDAAVPPAFGKTFHDDYTFGEKVARLCNAEGLISFDFAGRNNKYNEEVAFADSTYLEIFNFPLASGANELGQAGTMIITERIAKKFFGNEMAIGKSIRFENKIDFRISAVMKDIPERTDLRSEILLSYQSVGQYNFWYAKDDAWGGITSSIQTFTRLNPGVDPKEVEKVLPAYVKKYRSQSKNVHTYKLQPLADVHFNPRYYGPISRTTLWVLSIIGFFLVFTACLNFINLATAQAIGRSREVGVRKVLGGARIQLFWQFTFETFAIVVAAFLLSFSIAYALVPYVNSLLESRIVLELTDMWLWLFSLLLIGVVTFVSGAYPGLVLSGFKPVQALKGSPAKTGGDFNIRRLLITTQFAISQVLIIGLIVVVSQMDYFNTADLGYRKEAVVMIPLGSKDSKIKTLKDQFLQLSNVESVSACYSSPAAGYDWGTSVIFDRRPESEDFACQFKGADESYVSTFGLEVVAGRNLTASDTVREYLVNETMVAKLGETNESVLGRTLSFNEEYHGPIVGVIADFHDRSLHNQINPVFITTGNKNFTTYAVKINPKEMPATLAALEQAWSAMYPDQLYEYKFLDDQTAAFYKTEQTMVHIVEVFSFVALLIGCMGLYGLASFMAVQRTKEIGIRKVLGSSVPQILWIFGREFSSLVLVAFLIAAPIGWFATSQWLSNYEYRIEISAWIFVADLAFVAAIVLATVGFRTMRAATINPVGALRSE